MWWPRTRARPGHEWSRRGSARAGGRPRSRPGGRAAPWEAPGSPCPGGRPCRAPSREMGASGATMVSNGGGRPPKLFRAGRVAQLVERPPYKSGRSLVRTQHRPEKERPKRRSETIGLAGPVPALPNRRDASLTRRFASNRRVVRAPGPAPPRRPCRPAPAARTRNAVGGRSPIGLAGSVTGAPPGPGTVTVGARPSRSASSTAPAMSFTSPAGTPASRSLGPHSAAGAVSSRSAIASRSPARFVTRSVLVAKRGSPANRSAPIAGKGARTGGRCPRPPPGCRRRCRTSRMARCRGGRCPSGQG